MSFIGDTTGGGCLTTDCKYDNLVLGLVFGILGGICFFICVFVSIVKCSRGRPFHSNERFIKPPRNTVDTDFKLGLIFESGPWLSRYFQYTTWHGYHQQTLNFDTKTLTVTGSGKDDVGEFTIKGGYSIDLQRLALRKTYRLGTGNITQNLGHTVLIQVTWNPNQNQFVGKWYVRTHKYQGEGPFQLKHKNKKQFSPDSKV